jgi:hypothetical protein
MLKIVRFLAIRLIVSTACGRTSSTAEQDTVISVLRQVRRRRRPRRDGVHDARRCWTARQYFEQVTRRRRTEIRDTITQDVARNRVGLVSAEARPATSSTGTGRPDSRVPHQPSTRRMERDHDRVRAGDRFAHACSTRQSMFHSGFGWTVCSGGRLPARLGAAPRKAITIRERQLVLRHTSSTSASVSGAELFFTQYLVLGLRPARQAMIAVHELLREQPENRADRARLRGRESGTVQGLW